MRREAALRIWSRVAAPFWLFVSGWVLLSLTTALALIVSLLVGLY
jgi:hypothetical protein